VWGVWYACSLKRCRVEVKASRESRRYTILLDGYVGSCRSVSTWHMYGYLWSSCYIAHCDFKAIQVFQKGFKPSYRVRFILESDTVYRLSTAQKCARGSQTQFASELGDDRVSLKSMVGRLLLEKTGVVPGIELVNSLMTTNETLDSKKLFQA
jgi:hypothetical protein